MSRRERGGGLADRLSALGEVIRLGSERLPGEVYDRSVQLRERAGRRLELSGEHTVVALAGATGSGKSSLFNAVAGAPLATVGVRRPTTSATQAVVIGGDASSAGRDPGPAGAPTDARALPTAGSGPRSGVLEASSQQDPAADGAATALLDWLGVGRRVYGEVTEQPDLAGLVLLDLPDHDSTEPAHRAEVDRLVRLVDAFVWVLDPQKYADGVLHEDYLRPLAAHREVLVVALNQVDRLGPDDLAACVRDLQRLLADDGLAGVPVLTTSATTPDGAAPLRRHLGATVAAHRARAGRIAADLDRLAAEIDRVVPHRRGGTAAVDDARLALVQALATAAGVPAVVAAVGAAHERRGKAAIGWPPLRWLARFRPDPLRRLGLSAGARRSPGSEPRSAEAGSGPAVVPRRTSLPAASPVSRAGVDTALREVADRAGDGLPGAAGRRVLAAARDRRSDLADALDRAVGGAGLDDRRPPRWWSAANAMQWALLATAVAGAGWLGVLVALGYLQIDLEPPAVGPIAWPTLLLIGGVVGGLLLRVLLGPFLAVGAARRRRRAAVVLRRRVGEVADELVLAPVRAEVLAYDELRSAVRRLTPH